MAMHLLPPHLKLAILSSLNGDTSSAATTPSVLDIADTHSKYTPLFNLTTINANALQTLSQQHIIQLHTSGYVIIDGCGSEEMLIDARRDCQVLVRSEHLQSGSMRAASDTPDKRWNGTSYRGDRMCWIHIDDNSNDPPPQSVRRVIETARAIQTELNAVIPDLKSGLSHSQLAVYDGNGERYVRHRDTHATGPKRLFTVIYYANVSEWQDDYGGELRLFPYESTSDDQFVDVKPIGGRIIIFDSRLLHEVKPSYAQRIAITTWLT